MHEEDLKDEVLEHWNKFSEEEIRERRSDILDSIARRFNISREAVEKQIAEWESQPAG